MPFPDNFPSGPSSHGPSSSSSSSNGGDCTLSPAASAFSAMLSAFIGSAINGVSSGWLVAFMTGWIAWMAVFRVLVGGVYMLYRSVTNTWWPAGYKKGATLGEDAGYLMTDHDTNNAPVDDAQIAKAALSRLNIIKSMWPPRDMIRTPDLVLPGQKAAGHRFTRTVGTLNYDVTALGWFSWLYSAIYAPIAQIIWIAASASRDDNGPAKIVKGLTVAVTALPLCIDCRARYGASLKWGGYLFNLVNSLSCLLQGGFCAFLLVRGVVDLAADSEGFFPWPAIIVYPFFALVWMVGSFVSLPLRDGGRMQASKAHWSGYFLDLGVGIFAGIFLAAPALALYMHAQFEKSVPGESTSSGLDDIGAYLSCETQAWKRFAAAAP